MVDTFCGRLYGLNTCLKRTRESAHSATDLNRTLYAADGEDEQREPLLQAQATLEQKLE